MKHRSNYTRSYQPIHGFTLVELLVVISIIALLLSIMMPSLQKARESAKFIVCKSNLHQMYVAWAVYDTEHKELPPGNWGAANIVSQGVHRYLAKSYGITFENVNCPSALKDAYFGDILQWNNVNYDFGMMTYNYLGGHGGGKVASQYNGWYVGGSYMPFADKGFYPRKSLIDNKLNNSIARTASNPMFFDIAAWDEIQLDPRRSGSFKPSRSNHLYGKKKYQNVAFYDGHADKQQFISKKSWKLGQDYYHEFFLTDPAPPVQSRAIFAP